MQDNVRGEVRDDRGLKSALPIQPSERHAGQSIQHDGARDNQRREWNNNCSGRQVSNSEKDRGQDVGDPENRAGGSALRRLADERSQPCEQRHNEQT